MIDLWSNLVFEPLLNGLIVLYSFLFHNMGLAIIAFTIFIRLVTFPLTRKQMESSKKMMALQPKLAELQKKYAKDRNRLAQEQMKLYKETGMNPLGCLWPMLVQMPIWIALYQAVIRALAITPDALFDLAQHLYPWEIIHQALPLKEKFLWLNLAQPDRYAILPILVAGSMWAQQKMTTLTTTDPRQQSMNRLMLWFMPMMFGLFTIQFASGLALYWVTFNLLGIVMQYFISGWGGLLPQRAQPLPSLGQGKRPEYGKPGVQRQDRRGGQPTRSGKPGTDRGGGGGHHPQPRKGRLSGPGGGGGPDPGNPQGTGGGGEG